MNVNWFAQTPGIEEAAFGIFSHRSGLGKKKSRITNCKTKLRTKTNLNVAASSPHIDLSRLMREIGTTID